MVRDEIARPFLSNLGEPGILGERREALSGAVLVDGTDESSALIASGGGGGGEHDVEEDKCYECHDAQEVVHRASPSPLVIALD